MLRRIWSCNWSRGRGPAPVGVRTSRRIRSMLAGSCPSAKLGSVAGARPPGRFEETLPEVESQLDPRRVTSVTNFGWEVFYTQHQSPYFRVRILNEV